MLNRETDLLKEVEKLENQSKIAERDKNYELAISFLMQVKDNYSKLGLNGQVSITIKEILRLKHLIRDRKEPILRYGRDQGGIEPKSQLKPSLERLEETKSQLKSSLDRLREVKYENTQISEANGNVIL